MLLLSTIFKFCAGRLHAPHRFAHFSPADSRNAPKGQLWLRLKPAAAQHFEDKDVTFLSTLTCCVHIKTSQTSDSSLLYLESDAFLISECKCLLLCLATTVSSPISSLKSAFPSSLKVLYSHIHSLMLCCHTLAPTYDHQEQCGIPCLAQDTFTHGRTMWESNL